MNPALTRVEIPKRAVEDFFGVNVQETESMEQAQTKYGRVEE